MRSRKGTGPSSRGVGWGDELMAVSLMVLGGCCEGLGLGRLHVK